MFIFRSVEHFYLDSFDVASTDVHIYGENITKAICADVNQFAVYMIEGSMGDGKRKLCQLKTTTGSTSECEYLCEGQCSALGMYTRPNVPVGISDIKQGY